MCNLKPSDAIQLVVDAIGTLPACVAGSVVAAHTYQLELSPNADIDVFCYTEQSLITAMERLLNSNFHLDERFDRVRMRWLKYGMSGWHTNSIKFHKSMLDGSDLEVNLVYKLLAKRPLSSLSSILESFDFGLLATGYDLSDSTFRDMRGYLFPDRDPAGPLPMMPNKESDWRNGFISQYNGLREAGRYAKYHSYGHDLSLVRPVLVEGYENAASYLRSRGDADKVLLAQIYETIADKIVEDQIDELNQAAGMILVLDSLDQIMEALE